jgi:hypothetical protein
MQQCDDDNAFGQLDRDTHDGFNSDVRDNTARSSTSIQHYPQTIIANFTMTHSSNSKLETEECDVTTYDNNYETIGDGPQFKTEEHDVTTYDNNYEIIDDEPQT